MLENIKEKRRSTVWLYKCFLLFSSIFTRLDTKNLSIFFLFIGNPRSGHTLVGALLDAHPNILCSIEANVGMLLEKGFTRRLIFHHIKRYSQAFTTKHKCNWTNYSYEIKGLYQGRVTQLLAIGDKKGAGTTRMIRIHPGLISSLEEVIQLPIRILHVIRNPFDNIASIILRDRQKGIECNLDRVNRRIDRFVENTKVNAEVIRNNPSKVLNVYHENLIRSPEKELHRILEHVEVPINEHYILRCAALIHKTSRNTRYNVEWTHELRGKVEKLIAETDFLRGYSWNGRISDAKGGMAPAP